MDSCAGFVDLRSPRTRVATVLGLGAVLVAVLLSSCSGGGSVSTAASSSTSEPGSPVNTFPASTASQLENVVQVARNTYDLPGLAVWVSAPGKERWMGAYGLADVSTGRSLELGDHLPIGSVTKTFTATVILRLVEEGRLGLSDPIAKWVPQVQNASQITVKMLLNMTSGIYDEGAPGSALAHQAKAQPNQPISPQEIVALAVAHGPAGPPGQYEYSDTNYVILGIIAQDVTHQSIEQLIQSEILKPLHLDQTSFPTTATLPSPSATGYLVGAGAPQPYPVYDPSYLWSAGAMVSTPGDMATWAKALATGQLLSPQMQNERVDVGAPIGSFVALPQAGQSTSSQPSLPVAYGLGVFSLGAFLGHNGINNSYTDDVFYMPSRQITIVVMANGNNTAVLGQTVTDAATVSIADILLGKS
jgi:D-alanyl-D-alanine carboxypeptidase